MKTTDQYLEEFREKFFGYFGPLSDYRLNPRISPVEVEFFLRQALDEVREEERSRILSIIREEKEKQYEPRQILDGLEAQLALGAALPLTIKEKSVKCLMKKEFQKTSFIHQDIGEHDCHMTIYESYETYAVCSKCGKHDWSMPQDDGKSTLDFFKEKYPKATLVPFD